MSKKVNSKNFEKVLDKFKNHLVELRKANEKDALKEFCSSLNNFFDELGNEDAFGTEGQLDPRGDKRN